MPVISPENKIKMLWDLIMIFINIFLLFILTFQMSFDFFFLNIYFENNSLIKKLIAIFLVTIFILDIVLKFFTGYYKDGILVLQLEKLVKKYFFSGLGFDLIAFSPILLNVIIALNYESLIEHQEFIKYIGFLFFFKIFDVIKIF